MTGEYKVLVVDDNAVNLRNAVEAMEELGFEVLSASSAKEAIEIIKIISIKDDLFIVLSDMNMEHEKSGMEVFSVCSDLCVPCLIVTGGGLDHGRPAVIFSGPLFYPLYPQEKERDRLHAIGHILANEKTKEVWTEALRSFSRYWEGIERRMGMKSFIDFVFETRKEYRRQKNKPITRENQLDFQAGITPKKRDEK